MRSQPIEVVGGGLAGLAVGVGLVRSGIPVVVRESGRSPRHRVCGEFLRGVRPEVWSGLGLNPPVGGVRSTVRWWMANQPVAAWSLEEKAVAWSRPELEAKLRTELERGGGCLVENDRVTIEPMEGRVVATGRVLDATSPWFAMKCRLLGIPLEADLEMHVGRSGYVGLTRVGCEAVNVSGLFRADAGVRPGSGDPRMRLAGLLEAAGMGRAAEWVTEAEGWEEGSVAGAAGIRFGWSPLADEVCAVGDARVFIPPFTGRGMALALEGAKLATEAVASFWRGEIGWKEAVWGCNRKMHQRFSRPVWLARCLQAAMTSARFQPLVGETAVRGWFPVRRVAGWVS